MSLTDVVCRNSACPAEKARVRLADSGGLYLEISPNGSRRWFWKYRFAGKEKRLAWNYDPGTRRVRQLPEFGFDQPLAFTGGKMTIDSDRLFNGTPERYNWKLVGKREAYIPANAYKVHANTVKYADLLKPGHANPDFLRYELRRGRLSGSGELLWRPAGGRYSLRLEGSVVGLNVLTQESTGTLEPHGLAPERFTDQRARRPMVAANFEREAGRGKDNNKGNTR